MTTTDGTHHSAAPVRVRGDIAIVGMACSFPGARNLAKFWQNIVRGVDAVTDVPPERWDPDVYYDPQVEGRIYCKRGGYLGTSFTFNPVQCGTMPRAVDGAEPDQFLVLRAVYEALRDAGYAEGESPGERTGFILGRGNYLGAGLTSLVQRGLITEQTLQIVRSLHPEMTSSEIDDIRAEMQSQLPGFGADTAPGLIPNITTGRVANRLNLMGPTYTVDAACASSLIATESAARGLLTGQYDVALAGGVHIFTDVSFLQVFCAMGALSRSSVIRPFDRDADGTITGEGVGILVLKRLSDAQRAGDRIYAVIKGVGTSSDGKAMSVTAPRVEGEELALRRAYEMSGLSPDTIGLIEAHGTATPIGDQTEIEALQRVFGPSRGGQPTCALGSVKSMIGHAMPAAGAAAMIKTALALYHGVLPPTLNCRRPHDLLLRDDNRFYINSETRPWIHADGDAPRRAGVNAFGFGGVNAHVVLEEHRVPDGATASVSAGPRATVADQEDEERLAVGPTLPEWETEVCVLEGDTREALIEAIVRLGDYVRVVERIPLRDIAYTLNTFLTGAPHRVAIVASSLADLLEKLTKAAERLRDPDCKLIKDARGIYCFDGSPDRMGKVVFLFPGLGAQYVGALADLCVAFPKVRACFDAADRAVASVGGRRLSADLFPPPAFTDDQITAAEERLATIERANPAVMTANGAMFTLLDSFGVRADMMTGHSSGEWVVMPASGMIGVDEFVASMSRLEEMWRKMGEGGALAPRVMLAIGTDRDTVKRLAARIERPIHIANDNCPHQVVAVVEPDAADAVMGELQENGIFVERLAYAHGYHTPEFTYVTDALREYFASMGIRKPDVALYSSTTAKRYPEKPDEIVEQLAHTFARPLRFRDCIEAMYDDGARVFVEVGPRGNLTAFVDDILRGRPHVAIPTDRYRKSGITSLNHALAQLVALHVPMSLESVYAGRSATELTFDPAEDRSVDEAAEPGAISISVCCPKMEVKTRPPRTVPEGTPRPTAMQMDPAPAPLDSPKKSRDSEAVGSTPTPVPVQLSAPRTSGGVDAVLQEHFRVMESFLQTNEEIVRAYLDTTRAADTSRSTGVARHGEVGPRDVADLLPQIALPATSQPQPPSVAPSPEEIETPSLQPQVSDVKSLEQRAVVEAESAGSMDETATIPAARGEPEPQDTEATPTRTLEDVLLAIVSDRTGYPLDMLDPDLDMEADLGIDSIKRIEILGALQQLDGAGSLAGEVDMEEVIKLKTLREILNFLEEAAGEGGQALVGTPPATSAETTVAGAQEDDAPPGGARPTTSPATTMPDASRLTFAGHVAGFTPDAEVVVVRDVDINEDLYLHDHCFDPFISEADPQRERLGVIPLTVSLEMMAEVAGLLAPGLQPVRAKNVQAAKWIEVEPGGEKVTLAITARRTQQADEIAVTVARHEAANQVGGGVPAPLAQGTFVFAESFPPQPAIEPLELKNRRPSANTARQMYDERRMFHGPRFQGVVSIEAVGENGLLAQLEPPPTDNLLRSNTAPKFHFDPVVLDSAGQLVGYWPVEYLSEGFVLFPIRIAEVTRYRQNLRPGDRAECRLRIVEVGQRRLRADMDLIAPDGKLWMRITGWEDWRFYWDVDFYNFWRAPNKGIVSEQLELPAAATDADVECRRMAPFGEMGSSIWENLWVHLIMSRRELAEYRSIKGTSARRTEWVFGRAAAKDAVRMWVKRRHGLALYPADVEITKDERGKPVATGFWVPLIGKAPQVSISHKEGVAVAAAGEADVGIDLETIATRDEGFESVAFTEGERGLLQEVNGGVDRDEWITRAWCAKEAAGKALGTGLGNGLRTVTVRSIDSQIGDIIVVCESGSEAEGRGEPSREYVVRSFRDGDFVVAVAYDERSSSAAV